MVQHKRRADYFEPTLRYAPLSGYVMVAIYFFYQCTFIYVESVNVVVAALSSSTFFWFWNVLSDCRNLNRRDLLAFPFDPERVSPDLKRWLSDAGKHYLAELKKTSRFMIKSDLRIETFEYAETKPMLDQIDQVLAKHYGFTDEELGFIINYDIKYRMWQDSGEG